MDGQSTDMRIKKRLRSAPMNSKLEIKRTKAKVAVLMSIFGITYVLRTVGTTDLHMKSFREATQGSLWQKSGKFGGWSLQMWIRRRRDGILISDLCDFGF
jgi:hypothetical protein